MEWWSLSCAASGGAARSGLTLWGPLSRFMSDANASTHSEPSSPPQPHFNHRDMRLSTPS